MVKFLKSSFTVGSHVHFRAHYRVRRGMFCEENWENEALWLKISRRGGRGDTVCHHEDQSSF